jgi:hypothetical protein
MPEAHGLTELNGKDSFYSIGAGYAHQRTTHIPWRSSLSLRSCARTY